LLRTPALAGGAREERSQHLHLRASAGVTAKMDIIFSKLSKGEKTVLCTQTEAGVGCEGPHCD